MVSPVKKNDSNPKKGKSSVNKEEEQDNIPDASFDLIDQNPTQSLWYSIRIPGILPAKRSFHASIVFNDVYN